MFTFIEITSRINTRYEQAEYPPTVPYGVYGDFDRFCTKTLFPDVMVTGVHFNPSIIHSTRQALTKPPETGHGSGLNLKGST